MALVFCGPVAAGIGYENGLPFAAIKILKWRHPAPVNEGLVEARKAGHPELPPLHARLFEHLKRSPNLSMDETRAPVLDPGRKRTKTGCQRVTATTGRGAAAIRRRSPLARA